jgi:hypothetical protein
MFAPKLGHVGPVPAPNLWRLVFGFIIAPAIAAVAYAGGSIKLLPIVYLFGVLPALLFVGIPLYLFLRRRIWPTPLRLAVFGGVVAIVPWMITIAAGRPRYSRVGDCIATVDHVRTRCGWIMDIKTLSGVFSYGSAAGLIFWLIVIWRDQNLHRSKHKVR